MQNAIKTDWFKASTKRACAAIETAAPTPHGRARLLPSRPRFDLRLQSHPARAAAAVSAILIALSATAQAQDSEAQWQAWRAHRAASLAASNGWTTLIGLVWLQPGVTHAGGDPTNYALLPPGRAPASVGTFIRDGRAVRFDAAPGANITINGQPATSANLVSDANDSPSIVRVGDISIVVIERGERIGLRIRDTQAPTRVHFHPPDAYPYDVAWRLHAKFEPFLLPKKLKIADVTGNVQEMESPGSLVFNCGGREYRLDALTEAGETNFFIIFHDQTAGQTTYHSGRFLYAPKPGPDGGVTVDFNYAYSPPCAFTPYATCPLPPQENWLPLEVKAGELAPAGHKGRE